jgi:hypothetical protein
MRGFYNADGEEIDAEDILEHISDFVLEQECDARGLIPTDNSDQYDDILFNLNDAFKEMLQELHNSDRTHFNVLVGRMEKLFDEYRSI